MDNTLMAKTILEMANTVGKIDGTTIATKEKVDAHDVLLQDHTEKLNDINQRTYHLDSWKNGIINIITAEKEKAKDELRAEFSKELDPIKNDYVARMDNQKDIRSKTKDTLFDLAKMGVVAGVTWIFAKGKSLFALLLTVIK